MSDETLHYRITPSSPHAHLFAVNLTVQRPDPAGQTFFMPAWIPGSYMIRDFAKHIVEIRASCQGKDLALKKLDKQRWQAAPCEGQLQIDYTVYAWDLSVRGAHLDQTHAYFNGSSVFLAVDGQTEQACTLEIVPPQGETYRHWRLATTLPPLDAQTWQFGRFSAENYETLIDHPVEMGDFTLLEFEACGIPHAITLTGKHYADGERLKRDLKQICEYQIGLFGAAPMSRYLFQVMVVDDGYGGLEHRSSTSLLCSRKDLPHPGEEEISDDYRNFLGLCSHEYFHSWQVKQIKPVEFIPYRLEQESHTSLLWVFEGFTAYYDDLSLVRCGLISPQGYLELLGQTITRVRRHSGRFKQSLSESSFDAWTKFYKQDENAPNAIVSYYTQGSLVALILDLAIRHHSGGTRSLDDVMRRLWEEYGKTATGVDEATILRLCNQAAGIALDALLSGAVHGKDELPVEEWLSRAGYQLKARSALSNGDKGGKAGKTLAQPPLALGVRYGSAGHGVKLLNVFDGGPAQQAGLAAGDVIIAVDGLRATQENIEQLLAWQRGREQVKLHAFRRDEMFSLSVALCPAPLDTWWIAEQPDAEPLARALGQSWLQGS